MRNDHRPYGNKHKVTLSRKALDRYGTAFMLIPLHKPSAVRTFPNGSTRKIGKAPLDPKWTTKAYPPAPKVIAESSKPSATSKSA